MVEEDVEDEGGPLYQKRERKNCKLKMQNKTTDKIEFCITK